MVGRARGHGGRGGGGDPARRPGWVGAGRPAVPAAHPSVLVRIPSRPRAACPWFTRLPRAAAPAARLARVGPMAGG